MLIRLLKLLVLELFFREPKKRIPFTAQNFDVRKAIPIVALVFSLLLNLELLYLLTASCEKTSPSPSPEISHVP